MSIVVCFDELDVRSLKAGYDQITYQKKILLILVIHLKGGGV